MRLTAADRGLVRALSGEHAEKVEQVLANRSDVLVAMGGGVERRSLARDMVDWSKLSLRVGWSLLRRTSDTGHDAIAVERTPAALPGRLAFIRRFRPEENVVGVTADTPMAWPGWAVAARVLGASLVAVLRADRRSPSELTSRTLMVATACILACGYARRTRLARAYLFRPYRLESPLVAAALMRLSVDVRVAVGTTPIAAHVGSMVGSSAILSTAYQIDEFRALKPLGPAGMSELWGPTELAEMEEAYKGRVFPEHHGVIGVYTQGFDVRMKLGTISRASGEPHLKLEQRFLAAVEHYARNHPEVRLRLFPHPMERRHYRDTGEHSFGALLELGNVASGFEAGVDSIRTFDTVGLGLTTVSTVGFDRVHLGLRTIFYVGDSDFLDPRISSPFQKLFFRGDNEFVRAIERLRRETHGEFMARTFGAEYDGVWGPWDAGAPADTDDDNSLASE